mmetsp:Transcript_15197/g.21217  ORF Transcript_15197/g.21217 Transcript_15197/m.21217 type:complete len:268 (+) Transcript_15197:135-938(+)
MEPILLFVGVVIIVFLFKAFSSPQKREPKSKKATMWDEVKFFVNVNQKMERDYTIIVDKSGSMSGSDWFPFPEDTDVPPSPPTLWTRIFGSSRGEYKRRWEEARKALEYLAPHVCEADPDGAKLFFFSTGRPSKYENITSAARINQLFSSMSPGGGTDLAGVLRQALNEHFQSGKPETILVITDGQPNDENAVKKVIIDATKKLKKDEDLSISFVQIGNDGGATKFLECLDDELESMGAKFDIVDCVTTAEMANLSFSELIQKSIMD